MVRGHRTLSTLGLRSRTRWLLALPGLAMLALIVPAGVAAAPSQSTVTVGVAGAAPPSAVVTGGPITGQGDNALGQPLSPCPPMACESFSVVLVAPSGYTVANQIKLTVSVAYTTPPNNSGPGTLDTYIEDSNNNVVGADTGSHNPSIAANADVAPGIYTVIIAGSTGADNSYTATITAAGSPRTNNFPPSGPAITFSTPDVMSPTESVGEPTIVHSPASDNTVYSSGPWGTGTQRSIWYASADGGETFRIVNQCPPTSGEVSTPCGVTAPNPAAGSPNPPGGGDTDQRLDHTGKDYFTDLWALACNRTAETADHGASANQFAYGCQSATPDCTPSTVPPCRPEGSDRPWLAEFDPALNGLSSGQVTAPDKALAPLTYMEYNHCIEVATGTGCSYWAKSTDGVNYSAADSNAGNFGGDGYPSVDQVTGDVFEANNGHLNIGVPDANGNLTFLDDPGGNSIGSSLIPYAGSVGAADTLFSGSSMDAGRNLHITWTDSARHVYTSVASYKTNWKTFATPVEISEPPSNTNVFPWVVSGSPGRSDSIWYGTSSSGDPSINSGQEWYAYMSQVVWPVDSDGAVTLAPPITATQVQVSPHPAHYNSICLVGLNCITQEGDRNLADFFTVTIDHTGAAEVEYDDTSNGLEQAGFTPVNGSADHAGAPVVTIARQDSGPGLFDSQGTPIRATLRANEPSSAPVNGMSAPGNDALYPVIGGSEQPALELTGNHLSLSADGSTLNVVMQGPDLSATGLQNAATNIPGAADLQYVTRWLMCPADSSTETNNCTIYYAEMTANIAQLLSHTGSFQFYAGQAQSIDLCSVSACDPHAEYYPDGGSNPGTTITGTTVSGVINCTSPTAGTICISVPVSAVGNPTSSSLLEEVGSYSFVAARPQSAVSNTQAESDQLPLEIDGVCCFNFQAVTPGPNVPESPWTPALVGLGVALIGGGVAVRRRRHARVAAL